MLEVTVITLFGDMFNALTEHGITGKAFESGLLKVNCINPRDFTVDAHRTVDGRPFGGGPGMVMMVEPLQKAIESARAHLQAAPVLYMNPQGRLLDQDGVRELAKRSSLIFLAGRYEGIDQRLIDREVDEEWSIGDYVISGGELAAMVMIDAISRNVPRGLGHEQSAAEDSFYEGLLACPH